MYHSLIECKKILLYKEGRFICESNKVIGINEQGVIVYLGDPDSSLKAKKTYKLDHHLVSPSFVNTHTHLPMSLFRGLADNLSLKTWLEDYIFPLEGQCVDEEFIKIGTQLALIELIRSGVTTCCDMYFFNHIIAKVLSEAGMRAHVGIGIPSVEKDDGRHWKEKSLFLKEKFETASQSDKKIEKAKQVKTHPSLEKATLLQNKGEVLYSSAKSSKIKIALAPHAPYTVDSQTLKEIGEFAKKENFFLSIHVSESLFEQQEIQKKYQKTPVQYLDSLGLTGENSLFVHCVHVNEEDLKIMSKTKTSLSYNPESNMKLGNGIAPIGLALQEKVTVGLGTDGSASNNNLNFLEEMGTGAKLQSLKYKDDSLNAEQMFEIATLGGAKALSWDKEIGSLELGKQADLIALDLNSVSFYPFYNVFSLMVYTCLGQEISFVMCGGKVLMENYEINSFDEKEVLKSSRDIENKIKDFLKK